MTNQKILIVDDDREIVDLIEVYLANEDYELLKAYDGQTCLEILENNRVSLLVLDIMMPKLDGLAVCKQVRETSNIPIIFISAKTRPLDQIQGLSTGADDYITKPFHPLELVARIKAQMRRYIELNPQYNMSSSEIIVKDLIINPNEHTVHRGENLIELTAKEFDILLLLAQNRGQIFNSEQLYENIWKDDAFDHDNTIMVHIRKLRHKIGDDARKPKYIKTVWGVGYKIEK